jgi:hypothetical protein
MEVEKRAVEFSFRLWKDVVEEPAPPKRKKRPHTA